MYNQVAIQPQHIKSCNQSPTHHTVGVGLHAQPGLSGHLTLTSIIQLPYTNIGSVPMFPGTYVPRCLCSPVPMSPGTDVPRFCTLIVVISINRLQILPTPWYDSRLGFRFRVLVRVRVRVRLELQTVFRLRLGCGLGLSLYGETNPKLTLTKTQN